MKYLALSAGFAAVMMPGGAVAHTTPNIVHAHPHGAEGLIVGLAVIALAAGVAWMRR